MPLGNYQIPMNDLSRRFSLESSLMMDICELVSSGPYLNGIYTKKFEKEFAEFLKLDFITLVSSGTSALELSIKALQLPKNSCILMTANAGGYSAIATKNAGLKPRYVDVDENGLIDIGKIEENLESVSAVIVTHLYGQIVQMEFLLDLAAKYNFKIIEDCAHAIGTSYDSKFAGSFGDVSAFSFYPTKNLGGIGDAGAVGTNSNLINDRIKSLREYGWSQRYYSTDAGGGNFRNDEIQALVLLHELSLLNFKNSKRKSIWDRYNKISEKYRIQFAGTNFTGFVPHLAVVRIPNRESFIKHMAKLDISTSIHYPYPDYLQPGLISKSTFQLPKTESWCGEVVSIPLFPEMTEEEICRVELALQSFLEKNC